MGTDHGGAQTLGGQHEHVALASLTASNQTGSGFEVNPAISGGASVCAVRAVMWVCRI
jgi:hypothetical protein